MKRFFGNSAWCLASLALVLGACSKSEPSPTALDPKAFDSAAPAIRQAWSNALDAASRNDYGTAITRLRTLSRQGLPPEDGKTVYDAIVVYETKLREAAKSGDAEARKAMRTLGISPTTSP